MTQTTKEQRDELAQTLRRLTVEQFLKPQYIGPLIPALLADAERCAELEEQVLVGLRATSSFQVDRDTWKERAEAAEAECDKLRSVLAGLEANQRDIAAAVGYTPGPDAYEIFLRVRRVVAERDELRRKLAEADAIEQGSVKSTPEGGEHEL